MKRSFVLSLVAHLLILAILAALYFLAGPPPAEPRMVEVELQAPAPPPPAPPPQPPSKPTPPQKPKPQDPVQPPQPPQPTPAPPPPPPPATDDNIVPVKPPPQPAEPAPAKPPEPPPPPAKQADPPPRPADTPPRPPSPPVPPTPSGPPSLRLGADTSLGEIRDNGTGPSCKSPHNLYPAYPKLALQRGEKGSVKLRLHIDSHGDVILAEILESSGYPLLDTAAHDRLVTWHCNPATDDGAAVLDILEIQINFLPE